MFDDKDFDKIQNKVFKVWVAMFVFWALAIGGLIWLVVWAINKFTS